MNFPFIILFSLLIFSGCVKNTISIYINPEGDFDMVVHAHGHQNDILDNDFPMPKDNTWDILTTIDSVDADTYDMFATKHFNPNQNIPNNFYINTNKKIHPLLKHNIDVTYRNWFLYKTYSIDITFESRMVDEKYPAFIKIIDDPESNYNGWAQEVFSYLFRETLNRTDIEFNQKAIIERDVNTWLQQEILTKSDSIIIEIFQDLKEEGLDLLMHPINPKFYTEIDSIFNYLEEEYEITKLLIDDEFEIKLHLPGVLTKSNHDTNNADTLTWNFELKDFMNSDYDIYAYSRINYKKRTIFTLISSFLILMFFLFKRKK